MGERNLARIIFCLTLTAVLCTPSLPYIAYYQQDVSEYEKRLEEIAAQINDLKAQIKKEENRKSSLLSRLDKIGFNKKLIRKEISLYNIQMEKANAELKSLNNKIPALKSELAREKDSVSKILVTLYKFGRLNIFGSMLQAENVGSLLSENKHLVLLAQHQQQTVSEYMKTLNDLKSSEKKVESKKAEIAQLIDKAGKKKQDLDAEEKSNQALLKDIDQNKETHQKVMAELTERAEQLQKLMKKILSSQVPLPVTLIPLYEKKGKIPWPISGQIVTHFGLKRHPRFRTLTKNNGIEISPKKNVIVKSIHPGTVVYNDHFQGYGNLLIIDHGMSYYSLYGHCTDFLVKKGDPVQSEQPIAMVGDLGSLKGQTLYFEIRYKTKPLNPLQWLKR
ncbi:MAG: peptidoglycan DD-metalloendopeptidase family protein [Candidatus Aminicenantes bacterium]|nr:peptidoglycan DD-metalloendopeptidase family protein [Candidatus Aminicenantes bacterium]